MNEETLHHVVAMDDDVTSFVADEARLQTFRDASDQLSRFSVPRLVEAANPHEKLFYAFFDGTGNDADKDPLHATNVDVFRKQVKALQASDPQIASHYVAGVGTQDQILARGLDGALGHTHEARMEEMYGVLVKQAKTWRDADPNVLINVCSVGFSRGATQCAIFSNLLDQRGIVDLDSRFVDTDGRTRYTRHIAAPGMTPQAVGLFDPVSTGVQQLNDRRLAPSVVSGFQITALDERRVKFVSERILPLGVSEDGRFLNVMVAGAHSNIGGGYLRDGLSRRSFNLMSDYLNAQRPDAPMFEKVYEPHDPRLNRAHNSHEGMAIYLLDRKVDRATPEGANTRLAPQAPVGAGQVTMQEALPHGPQHLRDHIALGPSIPSRLGPIPEQPGASVIANVERLAKAEAAGIGPLPGEQKLAGLAQRFAGGAGVALGVGASVYDGAQTARRAAELMEQGNTPAAQSELSHALARNAGGWIGGATATYAVSAAGASGFVPAAIVAGDALLMSKAFDKAVDLKENREIFHQTDRDGVAWRFNGRDWERQATFDRAGDQPTQAAVGASYAKSQELGAMANARAVEFALGKVPPPQDPFHLPAKPSDHTGLDNPPWRRNPETETWERQVKTGVSGANDRGTYEVQIASPEQARRLDQEALGRIASNIANGREAVAQAYLEHHAAQRGQDHGVGVPAAVEQARAQPDQVQGHDGQIYRRNPDNQWSGPDGLATGNLAIELELTHQLRQPVLERDQQMLAALQARPAPAAAQQEHSELLHRYRAAGIDLNAQKGNLQAVQLATQRTRDAAGLTGPTMQQLQRDEHGHYGYDSPIAHLQAGPDGVVRQVATTTSEELRQAKAELRQTTMEPLPTLAAVSVTAPARADAQAQSPSPERAAPGRVLADDPTHPDHATYQRIHTWVSGTGNWNEEESRNVAASLYRQQLDDPLVKRVDQVAGGLGKDGAHNVFAVYAPHGIGVAPMFHAHVDGRQAAQEPAQQSLHQAETLKQDQLRQQALEQTQKQHQQQEQGPKMAMGGP